MKYDCNMQHRFTLIAAKAGIENAYIHSLRHIFASRGLENGIELKVMQKFLGHSTISMTADIYLQLDYT